MVKVTGGDQFRAKLKKLTSPEMKKQVGAAIFAAGQAIQVEAQLSITRGAVSGKFHVPSRPGEPPNADTHHLADNIETARPIESDRLIVEVSSNAEYAAALEYGTARIAPRPYMAPAVAKERKNIPSQIEKAIDIVIKRAGPASGD